MKQILLTIFTIPKPFRGHIEIIQRNALKSYLSLGNSVEVLLLGEEVGIAEMSAELNIRHIPYLEKNHFGTPTVNSAFAIAQAEAQGSIMAYVNADIILTSDILRAIKSVSFEKFLITGQRWDLNIGSELDFESSGWERQLRDWAITCGKQFGPLGMDCFIFPKGMYRDLPPFIIGRACWDNWIIYWTRKSKIPVIDATSTLTIVHQNHDYSHVPRGKDWVYTGPERDLNYALAGGWDHIFILDDANWILTPQGLKRLPLTRNFLENRRRRLPILYPRLSAQLDRLSLYTSKILNGVRRVADGVRRVAAGNAWRVTQFRLRVSGYLVRRIKGVLS